MPEPSGMSPDRKLQVVLAVLLGKVSAADGPRCAGIAEQTAEVVSRSPCVRGLSQHGSAAGAVGDPARVSR